MQCIVFMLLVGGVVNPVKTTFIPEPDPDNHLIELRTREINTRNTTVMTLDAADSRRPMHFLVHFGHRVSEDDRMLLESEGLIVEGYIRHGAFLVYGEPESARRLLASGIIDWYGAYLARDKIEPVLQGREDIVEMEVMLFPGADFEKTIEDFRDLGAEIISASENEYNGKLIIKLITIFLFDAASLDGVRWIEPTYEIDWDNDQCQWVIQTWVEGNRRVWEMGLDGEGVIGSTSDTGIRTDHIAFRDSTISITDWGDYPEHRKIVAYKPSTLGACFGDDHSSGHGTHTAGTVCGDDSYWGGTSVYNGMAPKTRLYFVDLGGNGNTEVFPADYRDLWGMPQEGNEAGHAKFISNSWSVGFGYNSHAWESDYFAWEHPEFLIIGTAGNNDPEIGAPKTAKNIMTVGATLNGTQANYAAWYSNPGPAPDGRIKPTIVAPGTDVNSASASGPSGYHKLTGTSMACPAVAGGVALLTQYFRDGWYPSGSPNPGNGFDPSAALLKALVVASADADFPGVTIPNNKIGWGRLDIDSVLYFSGDTRKLYLLDDTTGLVITERTCFQITIQSADYPLRVCLVWTDPPPEMCALKQLVNNLDLEVEEPGGKIYKGNNLQMSWSQSHGSADYVNVVELVRIKEPDEGNWTITVKGTDIPQGPQPFSVVATGDLCYRDIELVTDGIEIDDEGQAIPNHGIDPGEKVWVYTRVANQGSECAEGVSGRLFPDTDLIQVLSGIADFGNIPPGECTQGPFQIDVSSGIELEEEVDLYLEVTTKDSGYVKTLVYPVTIGVGIEELAGEAASFLEVTQSPFRNHLGIRFSLPDKGTVRLELFDETGRRVRILLDDKVHPTGFGAYTFAAVDDQQRPIPAGVYFVRLTSGNRQIVCKGLKIK
ncbi:S8 family serine peptidase [candidate division WOR-3 bacterium]|uniref:S8 family serine peptidase n=1 Tax=candidate division WOR-3 bacterium TaxID=2052148 RepID=A0A9D5QBQ2_UNCW3|nr:S8 family serine peptidase [candidate division WOR-3 bacterium]MBD3363838.1 S8 family serine peptidase [candidate division WOR-3 bacterium]